MNILLSLLFSFIKTETFKEVIKYGTRKLVESTDNGIDDELAEALLGDIAKSTKNKIKDSAIKDIIAVAKG